MVAPSDLLAALPMSGTAYRIGAGGADHIPIPADGLAVPGLDGVRLLRGMEALDFRDCTHGQAVALVDRIAPWATVYLCPGWERHDGLRTGPLAWAGHAWAGEGTAIINSGRRGPLLLGTLLHELWHLIENRLPMSDRVGLSVAMLEGRGLAWQGNYNSSSREILARAFSAYASAKVLEGFDVRGVDIFDSVLEGGMAA